MGHESGSHTEHREYQSTLKNKKRWMKEESLNTLILGIDIDNLLCRSSISRLRKFLFILLLFVSCLFCISVNLSLLPVKDQASGSFLKNPRQ